MVDEPHNFALRCNLVEYLKPLPANRVLIIGEALPPGFSRLAAKPLPTGSPTNTKTRGMVLVS